MSAYSIEEMVLEGQMEVKELFEFVTNNAEAMDAYSMEQSIFSGYTGFRGAWLKPCSRPHPSSCGQEDERSQHIDITGNICLDFLLVILYS